MPKIGNIHAREILDSRGNPTVEVELTLSNGIQGRAIVPSGASTGKHEALELRDGDKSRYLGKGVLQAVKNVNEVIKKEIAGKKFSDFRALDQVLIDLDGTENKSKLGANAILGVSMAFVCACAKAKKLKLYEYLSEKTGQKPKLPTPMINLINGGAHATNNVDIQEFMIVPVGVATLREQVRAAAEIFHHLKKIILEKGLHAGVGDEGGFAPNFENNEQALDILIKAIHAAGYDTNEIKLALDVAASEFHKEGIYHFEGKEFVSGELVNYYEDLVARYPIISIEDGMDEDDIRGWQLHTKSLGDKTMLVGDDLFVTNIKRLQAGIDDKYTNAILIKLNQIGTVSETIDAIELARKNGMKTIISHRSGETSDTFIADLAVGLGTGWIKTGSVSRTDRTAKYNQLMRIEEGLS